MGQNIVITSVLVLLTVFSCKSQNRSLGLYILFEKDDSLSYNVKNNEWYFYRSSNDSEPLYFVANNKETKPEMEVLIPDSLNVFGREELFSIVQQYNSKTIDVNREKGLIMVNFNWLNEIYESIYIVEKVEPGILLNKVKYSYIHVDFDTIE